MRNLEYRSYDCTVEERSAEEELPPGTIAILSGIITPFGSDSERMWENGRLFIERMEKGAFTDSIRNNDIVALKSHNKLEPLGRLSSGTLKLWEEDRGLAYKLFVPDTTVGRDMMVMHARKDVTKCSVGFNVREQDMIWSKRGTDNVCTLTRVNCIEVSLGVVFPAYKGSDMSHRSFETFKASEEMERARAKARLQMMRK